MYFCMTKRQTELLHPRRRSKWLLHQSECSWYGLANLSCLPSACPVEFFNFWVFLACQRSCRHRDSCSTYIPTPVIRKSRLTISSCVPKKQPKHCGSETILERWHKDDDYRKSLSDIEWTEEQIIQYDKIALEDHSNIAMQHQWKELATRKIGYSRWIKKVFKDQWINVLISLKAKRELKRLHDEHVKETSEGNTLVHLIQRPRQRRYQQFEELEECDYQVDPRKGMEVLPFEVTGKPAASNIFVLVNSVGTARRLEQKLEFVAILVLDWTAVFFFSSEMLFSRARNLKVPGTLLECPVKENVSRRPAER